MSNKLKKFEGRKKHSLCTTLFLHLLRLELSMKLLQRQDLDLNLNELSARLPGAFLIAQELCTAKRVVRQNE